MELLLIGGIGFLAYYMVSGGNFGAVPKKTSHKKKKIVTVPTMSFSIIADPGLTDSPGGAQGAPPPTVFHNTPDNPTGIPDTTVDAPSGVRHVTGSSTNSTSNYGGIGPIDPTGTRLRGANIKNSLANKAAQKWLTSEKRAIIQRDLHPADATHNGSEGGTGGGHVVPLPKGPPTPLSKKQA